MNQFYYMAILLPGFFVHLVLTRIYIGYGEKSDTLDKTLLSLIYNVPILIISFWLMKINFVSKLIIRDNDKISSLDNLEDIKLLIDLNLDSMFGLICVIVVASIIFGIIWSLGLMLIQFILNKTRNYKVFNYRSIYYDYFVKVKDSLPVDIFDLRTGNLIDCGYINEVLNDKSIDNFEILLIDKETYLEAKNLGYYKKIDKTYISTKNNLRVVIYKEED